MPMTVAGYVRRIVSGNQTRFKDYDLKLELNLVYVTDQVIIMGYPASGIQGLYRNHKKDVIKFLETRHGNNYWVFNFCPHQENSYDASIFGGRVSRYPFPDHHAPPLAFMPLVVREIHTWLSGSSDRVAVLHCKAGKGRSGMMACAYLLSLDDLPVPPQLERSYTAKQWARRRTERVEALPKHPNVVILSPTSPTNAGISSDGSQLAKIQPKLSPALESQTHAGSYSSPPMITTSVSVTKPEKSFTDALKGVLDFHTARRMKASTTNSTEDKEIKNTTDGVRIPSQRRFLYYWALLLAHEAPKHMWDTEAPTLAQSVPIQFRGLEQSIFPHRRVHLMQITLRMRETSKIKIVKAASIVIGKASVNGNKKEKYSSLNQFWASISKYDDVLADKLDKWEVDTRDPEGNMGKRHLGPKHLLLDVKQGDDVANIFDGSNWDEGNMLRSFAHLGVIDKEGDKVNEDMDGRLHTYALHPMSDKRWTGLEDEIDPDVSRVIKCEARSAADGRVKGVPEGIKNNVSAVGVLLDGDRAIKVKLYMGKVPLSFFAVDVSRLLRGLQIRYSWVGSASYQSFMCPRRRQKRGLVYYSPGRKLTLQGVVLLTLKLKWDD